VAMMHHLPTLIAVAALIAAIWAIARTQDLRRRHIAEMRQITELLPILQRSEWTVCTITGCNQWLEEEYGEGSYECLGLGETGETNEPRAITNSTIRDLLHRMKIEPGCRVRVWLNRHDAESLAELLESLCCRLHERAIAA
jgi:hypothetical protein